VISGAGPWTGMCCKFEAGTRQKSHSTEGEGRPVIAWIVVASSHRLFLVILAAVKVAARVRARAWVVTARAPAGRAEGARAWSC